VTMDEDWHNRHLMEEREEIEREGRAIRGCGLLALVVAILSAIVSIIVKIL